MGVMDWLPWVNSVKQTRSNETLEFIDKDVGGVRSMVELIDKHAKEFSDGATSVFHPLLFNGHLQSAYNVLRVFEDMDVVYYDRLMLDYPDGGVGALDFVRKDSCVGEGGVKQEGYVPEHQLKPLLSDKYRYLSPAEIKELGSEDGKPMLLMIHGLTGGSNEGYVRSMVKCITERYGFEACVLNSRGCAQSTITTPTLYCGSWTDDIRQCVKKLRSWYPNRKFYLVGVSLGASMTANYLGQEGSNADIACAAVLGNPWDMCNGSYALKRGILKKHVYSRVLAKNCVQMVKNNLEQLRADSYFEDSCDNMLDKITSLEQFDNHFTAKMFGFNTSYEYYRYSSSVNRLLQIRTPLIAINALDDPIVSSESLPRGEVSLNPYVLMLETSRGGHIGWFDAKGGRWYVDPLCRLFKAFHVEIAAKDLLSNVDNLTLPHSHKFQGDRLVNPFERNTSAE
ncbi:putative carboxylic ester hydrolase Ecym_2391 [Eremothecium cymbalariae DBVPG|uniref:Caspase family p10 domain-containing protein n=1 Tax=Eremothecium cymbalariae (strain CBS 270.75 / DBVPG 7215 / KCTC 17166 / NRRL Y-17582) TaxID=931890 RepID=G8JNQ6_ERECY|nr:Hypothetical protein Ecym_2391 [Eremothecium cymbalariae DBVPG\